MARFTFKGERSLNNRKFIKFKADRRFKQIDQVAAILEYANSLINENPNKKIQVSFQSDKGKWASSYAGGDGNAIVMKAEYGTNYNDFGKIDNFTIMVY